MIRSRGICRGRHVLIALAVAAPVMLQACGEGGVSGLDQPDLVRLEFAPSTLSLGTGRAADVVLHNSGTLVIGPITLAADTVRNGAGSVVPAAQLQATPTEVAGLNPGQSVAVSLSLAVANTVSLGDYMVSLQASAGGEQAASLDLRFVVLGVNPTGTAATITISSGATALRQGDVALYAAEMRDAAGALVTDPTLRWSVDPANAGLFIPGGRFVPYIPGTASILATTSAAAGTLQVTIAPRGWSGRFEVIGHGDVSSRYTSDLWLYGNFAYTGTWGTRRDANGEIRVGNQMFAWDISDPTTPALTGSVAINAVTVNDVKIRSDGKLAVITHEGSDDGENGISLVDLTNPARPSIITRFTDGLGSGVHNLWIEGNYVYAVAGGLGGGLRVVNMTDPRAPALVGSYYGGSSVLHDVYVRNGLAFLSHWNAGLIILDVGSGIAGGSPSNPVEISRILTAGGQVHNAWYWPAAGYVFVGEEDFLAPGIMHVVDARDLQDLKEVATFRVPGATPHNFWLDEPRGILYLAWYSKGIRALDVNGELIGELERQGREIASVQYGTGSGCFGGSATCTWAPQLHNGLLFVSDLNSGIWALRPVF